MKRLILCLTLTGILCAATFFAYHSETEMQASPQGFVETQFTDSLGGEHTFLTFVPYDLQPEEKRPLLLFLNGFGENGSDGFRTIENNFGIQVWEQKRRFPFLCAIPQCVSGQSWSGKQLEIALEFADTVARKYGTDPDRFYITGVSSGADGVWNAISLYPDRFAAAAAVSGAPKIDAEQLADSNLPIWCFYNNEDDEDLVQANRQFRRDMFKLGASPIVTAYSESGHNSWDAAYRSIGMYHWLSEQHRTVGRLGKSRFELLSPSAITSKWLSVGERRWTASGDELAVSDPNGVVTQPAMLVCDTSYQEFSLHLDVSVAASDPSPCRLAIVDTECDLEHPTGYEIVIPLPDFGMGGVKVLGGEWVAEISPLAQRQLRVESSNEIRVSIISSRLEVRINGWKAVDMPISNTGHFASRAFRPSIIASSGIRFQNLRIRAE